MINDQPVTIVAEMAQGFEGNYQQARLLIKAAASAGADAAKFQMVYADELATPDYKYYDLFRSLELSENDWKSLAGYAKECGIELYLDIFGTKSLGLSAVLGINCIKLHGTDISNTGLLKEVALSEINTIMLGAGGAYLSEIRHALEILKDKRIIILLGFQSYPTPNDANQIDRVQKFVTLFQKENDQVVIGFADHAEPADPLKFALAATAIGAGAKVIEKHLTLGKSMKMEDHESALNPDEFLEFTGVIRACADAMGKTLLQDDFSMSESEKKYRNMIRRHVVSAHDLAEGSVIGSADLVLKRTSVENVITDPGQLYGKKTVVAIKANEAITPSDII